MVRAERGSIALQRELKDLGSLAAAKRPRVDGAEPVIGSGSLGEGEESGRCKDFSFHEPWKQMALLWLESGPDRVCQVRGSIGARSRKSSVWSLGSND